MSEKHVSPELIEAYRERRLAPAELLAVDAHLADCASCRTHLAQILSVDTSGDALRVDLTAALAEPLHLAYDDLALYVDGALGASEREVAESHLGLCARCAAEATDLQALRADLMRPAEGAGSPRRRVLAFPRSRTGRLWLFAAAGLAGVAVTALLLGIPMKDPARMASQSTPAPPGSSSGAVLVALHDGVGTITLDTRGQLAGLPTLSPETAAAVRAALGQGAIETPAYLREWVREPGSLLGVAPKAHPLALVGPLGTAVESDRPTLRWRRLEGAQSYTASVVDADLSPVAASPRLTGTEWRVSPPLPRGRDYSWQVVAFVEGGEVTAPEPPAPEARFRVIEPSLLVETQRGLEACGDSHLLRGLLYARTGLLEEAERELGALVEANPGSTVAEELVRNVRALRPQSATPTTMKPAQ